MLLTDSEIMDINQNAEFDSAIGYARKIESAVLEKLKAQKPVGVFADVNRLTPEIGTQWEQMVDEAYDGKEYIHLYLHPLPPDDVVRDAGRYRWLRSENWFAAGIIHEAPYGRTAHDSWEHLDAAIDAAMKEMK